MATFLYPLFTIALLWLFFRLWRLRKNNQSIAAGVLILQLVIFCWAFDGVILSLGRFSEDDLLMNMSHARLVLRNLFVPLLLVTGYEFASRGEVPGFQNKIIRLVVWLISLSLTGFTGFIEWQLRDDLFLREFMGVVLYDHVYGFPRFLWVLFFIVLTLMGVLIWRKLKWVWVWVGGLIAVMASLFPLLAFAPLVAAGAQVVLASCLVATERRLLAPDYSLTEGELESRISQVTTGRSKKRS